MRFADIHNHLLPAVDDGCRSLDETIRYLERFAAEGVVELAMTPHVARPAHWDRGGLERRMEELRTAFASVLTAVEGRTDLPRLHLGQELFAPEESHLEELLSHPGIGLGDTGFLLVEFGFSALERPEEVIRFARGAGREVVIAHPERYRYSSPEAAVDHAARWVELGAFLQLNLGSLSGYYEAGIPGSATVAWRLLEAGLAHLLGSDDHGDGRPQLDQKQVLRALGERGGRRQAERLLSENPLRLLRGETPLPVEPLAAAPTHLAG